MSTSSSRPQNQWNHKHGLVSKSFKLNRSVVDAFFRACSHEGISQSSKLTSLILNYANSIERRYSKMVIREKYSSGNNSDNLLLSLVENRLLEISDDEFNIFIDNFRKNISTRKRFDLFTDPLDYIKDFHCASDLTAFIENGAEELVAYITTIIMRQIAIFRLMGENTLMPCQLRERYRSEINVHHIHGNTLFEVEFNLLPFETYMVC